MSEHDDLLAAFLKAPADRADEAFGELVAHVWHDGAAAPAALAAAPALVAAVQLADGDRLGRLLVLLGLLAETEYPAHGPLTAAVRTGMDRYLDVLRGAVKDSPLALAAVYLVAHFPADRDAILAAAAPLRLDPPDQTRLERALTELDRSDPDLGRAWPSPAEWDISAEEREFDRRWISTLSPEMVDLTWQNDTRSVLGTLGGKALWAQSHGSPVAAPDTNPYAEVEVGAVEPGELGPGAYARHAAALRCPTCFQPLAFAEGQAHCARCSGSYPIVHGVLDLSRRINAGAGKSDAPEDVADDALQNAAVLQGIGFHYETGMRPNFLRIMGSNWDGAVTPTSEDDYIADQIRGGPHQDGTVLDLAAGAGRWTAVLADAVGAGRVLALDLNEFMLYDLRSRLPEVAAVRASALDLPFADSSLDAVNFWNALQAVPEPDKALREVGRTLRPGGLLTLLTMRWGDDPVYRYFQKSHYFPARPEGFVLFSLEEIDRWLAEAGLRVVHREGPGTFVIVTAEKAEKKG